MNRPNNPTFLTLTTGHPAQLFIGLTVWCLWFVVVYGGLSVACERAWSGLSLSAFNPINATLVLITLATALGLAWGAWVCWRSAKPRPRGTESTRSQAWFIARLSAGLYALSAGAALVVIGPMLVLPPCL